MAGSVGAIKVICLALMCMMLVGSLPNAVEGLECGQVTASLAPCISYLRGAGGMPPACCAGVKTLNTAAKTSKDRQDACRCLISASKAISGINFNLAAGLPAKCGVQIPYKISPSTDCNKVN